MSRVVPATGPTNSPLLAIVGEAPGAEEERLGQPFVGPSGNLLTQMLSTIGVSRDDCYITNVSNIRPPANDFGKAFYDDDKRRFPNMALLDQRERLNAELAAVKPKLIVPMGAEALKAVAGQASISNYRGTLIEYFGKRILPTYHPAYVLRSYGDRPIVEADLKKALRQATNPSLPKTYFNTNPTFSEVMALLKFRHKRYALDVETLGRHNRCIGLAWSKWDAMCIPLVNRGAHHWTESEETEILSALNELFLCGDCEFVLQNSPYDFTRLADEFGFEIKNFALDTMFAHHLLFPELPKGLDFLCSIYTDHPMYWSYDRGRDSEVWQYNCMDCVVTFEAAEEIECQLRDRGLVDYYKNVIHKAVPALTRVQSRGVLIDETERSRIGEEVKEELKALQVKIDSLVGRPLSPQSSKQVMQLVYEEWKLPKQLKPQTKRPTADGDALNALARKCSDSVKVEILKSIVAYREKKVLLSTFCEMPLAKGRVKTSYNIAGTVTGRLSSSATPDGIGGNLQNIPRGKFRRVFTADPGKVLIKADLSQAEYRVLLFKARITRVIERLKDPTFSIHYWNASENIYQVPRSQVTKQMYDDAKNGVYGANYGIGALKVSRMYNMDLARSKMIIDRYHAAVPEIRDVYQLEIRETIQSSRTLRNPLGRERIFFGRLDDELYRAAYSHYCQSTVADVISLALIDLDTGPDWLEIMLQVHDELVVQVPEDRINEGADLVRTAMQRELRFDGVAEPLVIPVELKVGRNWFDTKPVEEFLNG